MNRAPDTRALPSYAPGEIDLTHAIQPWTEMMARDTWWPDHSHPTHELLWNERGASTSTIGRRTWTITSSMGLWIPAGMLHSGWMGAGTDSRAAQFRIASTPAIADGPVAVDVTPMLRLLLDRLGDNELSPHSRATTEAMVLDVLVPAERGLLLQIPESARLAPIVSALRENPADHTTLEQWAIRVGLSARTITRLFLAETGVGFSRWVACVRTQTAIAMLARGHTIEDIADAVGFRSVSAFGTAFRRVTGMSPGKFREQ